MFSVSSFCCVVYSSIFSPLLLASSVFLSVSLLFLLFFVACWFLCYVTSSLLAFCFCGRRLRFGDCLVDFFLWGFFVSPRFIGLAFSGASSLFLVRLALFSFLLRCGSLISLFSFWGFLVFCSFVVSYDISASVCCGLSGCSCFVMSFFLVVTPLFWLFVFAFVFFGWFLLTVCFPPSLRYLLSYVFASLCFFFCVVSFFRRRCCLFSFGSPLFGWLLLVFLSSLFFCGFPAV